MKMKYIFTGETKDVGGITLKRIKRLSDGLAGGWLESEVNLSHDGTCFVFDNAQVFGNARVSGNTWVFGDARVFGDAWVYGDARVSDNEWVSGDARVFASKHIVNVVMHPYNITVTPQNIVVGCHLKKRDGSDGRWSDLHEATPEIKRRYLPLLRQLKKLVPRAEKRGAK